MKATEIFKEYHDFVEVVDQYLDKEQKAEQCKSSFTMHDMRMVKRNLKIAIEKFRMTNQVPRKRKPTAFNAELNFLGR